MPGADDHEPPLRALAPRRAPTGSTRTAQAFSSGCVETGSTSREVTSLSAPAPGGERAARPSGTGRTRRRAAACRSTRSAQHRRRRGARRTRTRSPSAHATRAASAGCSSTNGSGSAASSAGDLPVRVIVCHWLATRPVVSTSGKSASGGSAGSPCGAGASRARPSRRGEAAVGVQPLGARVASPARHGHWSGPSRSQPRVRDAGLVARPARGERGELVVDLRRRSATRSRREARARGRTRRRSPSPAAPRRAGRRARASSVIAPLGVRSSSRPSPATARRAGRRARARVVSVGW